MLLAWGVLGYRVEQLPSADDIRLFLVGAEARHALHIAKRAKPETPPAAVLKRLGYSQADIAGGLRVLRSYGGDTVPLCGELGVW